MTDLKQLLTEMRQDDIIRQWPDLKKKFLRALKRYPKDPKRLQYSVDSFVGGLETTKNLDDLKSALTKKGYKLDKTDNLILTTIGRNLASRKETLVKAGEVEQRRGEIKKSGYVGKTAPLKAHAESF